MERQQPDRTGVGVRNVRGSDPHLTSRRAAPAWRGPPPPPPGSLPRPPRACSPCPPPRWCTQRASRGGAGPHLSSGRRAREGHAPGGGRPELQETAPELEVLQGGGMNQEGLARAGGAAGERRGGASEVKGLGGDWRRAAASRPAGWSKRGTQGQRGGARLTCRRGGQRPGGPPGWSRGGPSGGVQRGGCRCSARSLHSAPHLLSAVVAVRS